MPELPEVETVKETLKRKVLNKLIIDCNIYYNGIIENMSDSLFISKIKGEKINNITRRGKWLVFELTNYYLLSHLRMEGKYNIRVVGDNIDKHEHVVFTFSDKTQLRYRDTRKFGKMHLIEKDKLFTVPPLSLIGLEPWDEKLTIYYLKTKLKGTAIKTQLLDQTIIAGIGNIYADEILFLCKINPTKKGNKLSDIELENIIKYTKIVLENAIKDGGTTIRTYTSSEGVHGRFQQNLLVHNKKAHPCVNCGTLIDKMVVGGRGTFYCPKCQK